MDRQIKQLHEELYKRDEMVRSLKLTLEKYKTGVTQRQAHDVETEARQDVMIQNLQAQLAVMEKRLQSEREKKAKYEQCFTPGQKLFIKTGKRPKIWSEEDISSAMEMYLAGPKAYRLIWKRYKLPAPWTLKKLKKM